MNYLFSSANNAYVVQGKINKLYKNSASCFHECKDSSTSLIDNDYVVTTQSVRSNLNENRIPKVKGSLNTNDNDT